MVIKLLKRMFGSRETVKETLAMVRDAGDAMVYTDEEKADNAHRNNELVQKVLIDWLTVTQGQNLTRRVLAVLVAAIWAFLTLFSWVTGQLAIWHIENADKLKAMTGVNEPYLEQVTGAMMLVLAFYFAAPHMGKIVGVAMEKFSGRKTAKDKPHE